MNVNPSKQSGFTLVEIAIVLVIIGVLLAGVLKGQGLINNAHIKGIVNDMNGVSAAYNGYMDRYHVQPGTETAVAANTRGWSTTAIGASPLVLPVGNTFTAPTASQQAFWQVLGASGLFSTSPNTLVVPTSSNGGLIGVTITPFIAGGAGTNGVPGVSVCESGVSGIQAEGVDTIIDGQLPATNIGNNVGNLQGILGASPTPPAGIAAVALAYSETAGQTWTLCRSL